MILICAVLIFCACALLIVGVLQHRQGAAARARDGRLQNLGTRNLADMKREISRDLRKSALGWLDAVLHSNSLGAHLELLLYQSGLRMRGGVLVLLTSTAAMAGYFTGLMGFHRLLPALVFFVAFGCVPYLYVCYRKHQRMQAFAREFPDALDLLVNGLRAGLSFTAALQVVAQESPDPVGGEFAITVEEQALGLEFREAMNNLMERVDVMELRFFVTAVLLHRETGGNLAEVLTNASNLIRDRFRVLGDIKTFTTQGKLTGVILVCLPIGIGLFTAISAPDYFRPMLESEGGIMALWFAAGLQVLGFLVIFKIVRIRV